MRQLELPIEKEQYKYNLYLNCKVGCYFATNDRKKLLAAMGKRPFGWGYEVKDENGKYIDEFIPF